MTTKSKVSGDISSFMSGSWSFLRVRSLGMKAGLFALGVTVFYEGLAMALLSLISLIKG